MGCMGFGNAKSGIHSWTLDEEYSRAILKRGLELGVNFFDTAAGYQSGTSEPKTTAPAKSPVRSPPATRESTGAAPSETTVAAT